MTRPITRPMVRLGDNGNTRVKKRDVVFCLFQHFTRSGAALHDDSQVVEHAQGSAMTYREHHGVDKHKGKQEVDEMDNQVAWREKKGQKLISLCIHADYISYFTGLFHFFLTCNGAIKLQIPPCITATAV